MFGSHGHTDEGGADGGIGQDSHAAAREEMIEVQLRRRGVVKHSVLEAMRAVPRHWFVSHAQGTRAYADQALPSLEGQTISQPFMVAMMTQELDVRRGQRVLELGTGTGYQTAILAYLVNGEDAQTAGQGGVFTVERIAMLSAFAQRRLEALGVKGVHFFVGDGSAGWPAEDISWEGARANDGTPLFDRILVTAGAPSLPEPVMRQLADGGILVVPIGPGDSQMLMRIERRGEHLNTTQVMECRFVPLVGAHAWGERAAEEMQRNQDQRETEER